MTVADEAAQARCVVEQVLEHREAAIALKQQAVLFRASHHSAALELELGRRNIPFVKFGGLKFLEAAHVKDVLAVLRWAENPRDRLAGFRVAQLLPGIGPATARRVLDAMDAARDPCAGDRRAFTPPHAARATSGRRSRRSVPRSCARQSPGWPGGLERVLRLVRAAPASACTTTRDVRHADLRQLERIAAGYPIARALPHRADARSAAAPPATKPARRCTTRTT